MMNLGRLGLRKQGEKHIAAPPANAQWRNVVAKPQPAVRAALAEANADVRTEHGVLRAVRGRDYIVEYDGGARAVVRADIFEKTYEPLGGGLYRKRTDVLLRYFTLKQRVVVETLEGPQTAEPGDWIMQGVEGELWPVSPEKGAEKYDHVQ